MGVAAGDFDNDGHVDLFITCVGQSRLFQNTGKGTFVDVTATAGLGGRNGVQHVGAVVRLRPRRAPRPARLQLRPVDAGSRTCSAAWTASRSPTARPKPIAARPAGCSATAATARSRTSRPRAASSTRRRSRSASRCSTTTSTAGPTSSSPTTRSRTSSIATTATARSPDVGAAGGPRVQRGRQGARRHGRRCRRLRQHRRARARRHELRRRDARPLPPRRRRAVRRRGAADGDRPRDAAHARLRLLLLRRRSRRPLDLLVVNGHIDDTVRNVRHASAYAQSPHLFQNDGQGSSATSRDRSAAEFATAEGRPRRAPSATSIATATSTC